MMVLEVTVATAVGSVVFTYNVDDTLSVVNVVVAKIMKNRPSLITQ